MAERGRRWFAITWIGLLFVVHGVGLSSVLSELADRHDHGVYVAIGPVLLAVLPVVVKICCLLLIFVDRRAGWYGYLLTTVVSALVALVTFAIAGQDQQAIGANLIALVGGLVTTWLLWVAIAPYWESFR